MKIEKIDGFEIYKWNVGCSTFEANIKCGARLMKWDLSLADGVLREVLFWDKKAPKGGFGENFSEARGGNPILFPFAGRSFVNGKSGLWKTPEGEVLPMHIHGYASMGEFEIVEIGDRGFKAKYLPNDEAKKAYPYDYNFFVEYSFEELSLTCKLTLENLSDSRIPWGAGTHFFFTLPWHKNFTRENYRIVHDAKEATHCTKEGNSTPSSTSKNCFADPEIHNRVLARLKSGNLKFGLKNGEEDISVIIDGGGKPAVGTCVVTWAEFEDSPYYCVEPWMSPPRSSEKPKRFVESGGIGEFSVKISLE